MTAEPAMVDGIRLLFVDDEEDFLDYTARRLRRRGLQVSTFRDPAEALAAAGRGRFDVALLNLRMPGIGGDELLRRLKAQDPRIEVIILTGHGSIRSAFDASRAGGFEYLVKPCDLGELVAAIAAASARREGTPAGGEAYPARASGPWDRLRKLSQRIRHRG